MCVWVVLICQLWYEHRIYGNCKKQGLYSLENIWKNTLNDKYKNFVITNIEAAVKCIPTKARAKCRVPWESVAIWDKWDIMKKHPYLIKEIQQTSMFSNLKKPREN